ncbi:GT2 family glycosyltransferase [Arthrobacter sp. AG258]|nr:GT2 family glycosyltransferase [Arthrobacter sp. AG258]
MGTDDVRLGVVVVNYFSSSQVKDLLDSLRTAGSGCETYVCVVDNSCSDQQFETLVHDLRDLASAFAALKIVRSESNMGYGRGNNLGWATLRAYKPETVLIANPDVVFLSGNLAGAMTRVRDSAGSIFGTPTRHGSNNLSGLASVSITTGSSRQLYEGADLPTSILIYPGGHFLAVSADTWEIMGGFSEDFFLYGEEADLTLRMKNRLPSSKVDVLTEIAVAHSGGLTTGSSGEDRKSVTTYRHGTRSSIVLFRKHRELRPRWPLIVALRCVFGLKTFLLEGPRAGIAVFLGVVDGLCWRPANEPSFQ